MKAASKVLLILTPIYLASSLASLGMLFGCGEFAGIRIAALSSAPAVVLLFLLFGGLLAWGGYAMTGRPPRFAALPSDTRKERAPRIAFALIAIMLIHLTAFFSAPVGIFTCY